MFDPEDNVFLLPGPVKMHPRVLRAMSRPAMAHRSPEFSALLKEMAADLADVFQTSGDVAIVTGSGTAGMEMAVSSLVGPGEKVLALSNGKFGQRMVELSKMYGDATVVTAPWGKGLDADAVRAELAKGGYKAVTFVLNETSTAVMNPGAEICAAAKEHGALVVMDGVSAVGSTDVPVDDWGVDVCIVGSQKCLAAPSGLAFLSVSAEAYKAAKRRGYYLDLKKHVDKLKDATTPFTPAVPLFLGASEAFKLVMEEGLEKRFERTQRLAQACRQGALAMNLPLYADREFLSPTVTGIRYPEGVTDDQVRGVLKKEFGVVVAGGQDAAKGTMFRIGHLGSATAAEVGACFVALEAALGRTKHDFERGKGVAAVARALAG